MELDKRTGSPPVHDGFTNPAFQSDNVDRINSNDAWKDTFGRKHHNNESVMNMDQLQSPIGTQSDRLNNKLDSDDEGELTRKKGWLELKYDAVCDFYRKHKIIIWRVIYGILLIGFFALVIAACVLNFHRALALFVLTMLAIFFVFWDFFMARYENKVAKCFSPCGRLLQRQWFWMKWVVWLCLIAAVICWLIFDTARMGTHQLISFGGLVMYVLLMFLFSKHPARVRWRPVFWGIGLQFVLGLVILRTKPGYDAFNWLGIQVQTFLEYSDTGAKFVFGEKYTDHFFAFKVMPIVVFFSTVMSMLYYTGFMQWIIKKVGWIMQVTMGTSPTESLVASGNIFVGQTESPLLIRPYLESLTISELHAIMTAGFSTIAGSVLGAYISFGVSATHLITASVMSAPASLAMAKLFWPETRTPKVNLKSGMEIEKSDARNILEAASHGASASIGLVANIVVNLMAFLSVLAFCNAVLSWLGNMFDYPQLSFEVICSYVFMPFSFMMGVDWEDSFIVGKLIGYKTFFNEFVAYEQLAKLITKRKEMGPEFMDGTKQYMSIRSETIATYALCGFANFGSLGIVIGGLTSMAPSRKGDIARSALRALIAGTVSCFMTACIAGIVSPPVISVPCNTLFLNTFRVNSSLPENSTEIVDCCLNLFNRTIVDSPENFTLPENYTMSSLTGCCQMLNSPSFNCSWFPPSAL
ncbi:solute carrier family 28 member 3 [Rhinatrema bivittatum]|uniref:solute carrier family 28 member 3 n=1 Tax=Rhinatrema bivittatum TaxID=194408 RepID=UPI00112672A5|nr:solute carrier family 28 member 3 [Rhinatrema bivittatum]